MLSIALLHNSNIPAITWMKGLLSAEALGRGTGDYLIKLGKISTVVSEVRGWPKHMWLGRVHGDKPCGAYQHSVHVKSCHTFVK